MGCVVHEAAIVDLLHAPAALGRVFTASVNLRRDGELVPQADMAIGVIHGGGLGVTLHWKPGCAFREREMGYIFNWKQTRRVEFENIFIFYLQK